MIRIFGTDATTIYEWNKDLNAGADEVLELAIRSSTDWGKSTNEVSRILIRPHWAEDSKYSFATASLRLFAANVEGSQVKDVSSNNAISIHPLRNNFVQGTGRYFDNPVISDVLGTTWNERFTDMQWSTPDPSLGHASSSLSVGDGGGVWYTGSNSGSTTFDFEDKGRHESDKYDMNVDISQYLTNVSNSLLDNHGLIIKFTSEGGTALLPQYKFFSDDTNTIYAPRIEYKTDDYTWSTTKPTIGTGHATVYYKGNSGKYDRNSWIRFRPVVRETFPTASYATSSVADTIKTFSQGRACYAIVDVKTEEEFISFDDTFTRVSADNDGMYFDIYADSLYKGRLYKLVLRVNGRVGAEGTYEYFDNKDYFEVV